MRAVLNSWEGKHPPSKLAEMEKYACEDVWGFSNGISFTYKHAGIIERANRLKKNGNKTLERSIGNAYLEDRWSSKPSMILLIRSELPP